MRVSFSRFDSKTYCYILEDNGYNINVDSFLTITSGYSGKKDIFIRSILKTKTVPKVVTKKLVLTSNKTAVVELI